MAQSSSYYRNGRPTRTTQLQIQKELRKYFELGISASSTSSQTGKNIKTVCNYFNEFAKEIKESESIEFLDRQENARNQIIVTFDRQILLVNHHLEDIEDQIKKFKQDIEKLKNETEELERQIKNWLKQDTPKFLEALRKKNKH